jgi:disulfide bond formation protein DsbB
MAQALENLELGASRQPCCPVFAVLCERLALLAAAAALAGSLYLSIGMRLQACPLCIYERTFLMGVVTVLGLGLFLPALRRSGTAAWLALPLTVAGLGVVGFHVWLELTQVLVCPYGVLELGTAPKQSLATFVLVTLLLVSASLGSAGQGVRSFGGVVSGIVLGGLLAAASVTSGPRLPPASKTVAEAQADQAALKLEGCTPVKAESASSSQP